MPSHVALIAAALLFGCSIALGVVGLTRVPPPFGDEAWYGSTVWSWTSGHGLEPGFAAGSGPYDGVLDHWSARVGSLPHAFANLLASPSFGLFRAISLLTATAGLVIFVVALSRRHGMVVALLGAAALATTWGFVQVSHWIRWDAMAFLVSCVFLSALLHGPPTPRIAALLGGMLGLAADFSLSLVGVLPGVFLLVAWAKDGRGHRLRNFGAGLLIGGLALATLHDFWDWGPAREQYEQVFEPTYGEMPLLAAVGDLDVTPIRAEVERYLFLTAGPARTTLLTLLAAAAATVLLALHRVGVKRELIIGSAAAIVLATVVLILARGGAAYSFLYRTLPVVLIAGTLLVGWSLGRSSGEYPKRTVPSVLFLAQLGGLALLVGNKGGAYPTLAVPYGMAAIIECLRMLTAPRRRVATASVALAAAALAGGAVIISEARDVKREPALMAEVSRMARATVPRSETIVGDHIYWWLFRDHRFLYNSAIWQHRWAHGDTLDEAIHRICPTFILWDDLWRYRYQHLETGRNYANLAPTDPAEAAALQDLIRREYRTVRTLSKAGRMMKILRRRSRTCPPVEPA